MCQQVLRARREWASYLACIFQNLQHAKLHALPKHYYGFLSIVLTHDKQSTAPMYVLKIYKTNIFT